MRRLALLSLLIGTCALGQRARDLGIPFDGRTGPLNAITDVAGVEVGHATIVSGDHGAHAARTGVTAVLPRGKASRDLPFAAWETLNGNGEMTGTTWMQESGFLEGPVVITNTHSVGAVRDAVIAWSLKRNLLPQPWALPVIAETFDGFLNDINAFHVKERHVMQALDGASGGPVREGSIGGGTGMICFGFKCGIGTASRALAPEAGNYAIGVLVQSNFGSRPQLRVAGVPVGALIEGVPLPTPGKSGDGSIIVVIGTDAPLLPHQLKRLARRAGVGVARSGGTGSNGSGDIFVAFSTANPGASRGGEPAPIRMLPNERISPLFEAAAQATEEAIINALVAGETMTGRAGNTVYAIPKEQLKTLLRKHNRLANP